MFTLPKCLAAVAHAIPVSMRQWPYVWLMLVLRLRRRPTSGLMVAVIGLGESQSLEECAVIGQCVPGVSRWSWCQRATLSACDQTMNAATVVTLPADLRTTRNRFHHRRHNNWRHATSVKRRQTAGYLLARNALLRLSSLFISKLFILFVVWIVKQLTSEAWNSKVIVIWKSSL